MLGATTADVDELSTFARSYPQARAEAGVRREAVGSFRHPRAFEKKRPLIVRAMDGTVHVHHPGKIDIRLSPEEAVVVATDMLGAAATALGDRMIADDVRRRTAACSA
jgi:hypothetical protein